MTNPRKIPWKRIFVEAIAIVASILLAFGIDAWWDDQLERSREKTLLARLGAEFATNLDRIDRGTYSFIVDASLQLFHVIDEAMLEGETTAEVPTGMLRLVLISGLFEADMPILDSLTKAGKLDEIDESRIIAAVSAWERQLRDYTSMAERERRHIDTLLLPALYKRGDIGPLQVGPHITQENHADPIWRVPVVINVDMELKGLVAGRYERVLDSNRDFEALRTAAVEVIEAIEASANDP